MRSAVGLGLYRRQLGTADHSRAEEQQNLAVLICENDGQFDRLYRYI